MPRLSATGCNHSVTGLSSVTRDGDSAGPLRCSGPRSPASTTGPHIRAARWLLSASASICKVFGRISETLSPLFHVCFNSTYDPGRGKDGTFFPFTCTAKPSPAHEGRRKARVKAFGRCRVNFTLAPSPSGKVVDIVTVAPAAFQSAVDGT